MSNCCRSRPSLRDCISTSTASACQRVAWDDERLQNALALYGSLEPDSPYLPLLQFFLPYIQPADVELGLTLPLQPGAQAPTPAPWITE